MSYYLEARAVVKGMKDRVEANKQKRERRAEQVGAEGQGEDPFSTMRVDGRSCRLFRNDEAARAIEHMEGMLPWNGKADNMIDRFDGRALLDFYREPDNRRARPQSELEVEEEELAAFEAFRDLVKIAGKESEKAGLAQAEEENLQMRANAKAASVHHRPAQLKQTDTATTPAGFGAFGAVGFSYGVEAAHDPVADSGQLPPPWAANNGASSSCSDSDSGTDSDEDSDESEQQRRLGEEDYEDIAATFGIVGYQAMLRRALRDERREAEGRAPKPKWQFSRKKAAQRAKRMKGQGQTQPSMDRVLLSGPTPNSVSARSGAPPSGVLSYAYRSQRRGSPSYVGESGDRRSARSRSRSNSPGTKPRVQYITSFATGGGSSAHRAATNSAYKSSQLLPKRSSPTAPTLSSPRGTDSNTAERPPDPAINDAEAQAREAARAERYEARQRERAQEKTDEKTRQAPSTPADKKAKGGKESQQERMQRLMKAQISKQVAKDSVTVRAKRAAEERDAAARRQIERAAMGIPRPRSPSPVRYRPASRSRSPRRDYQRPRSPSRHQYATSCCVACAAAASSVIMFLPALVCPLESESSCGSRTEFDV